MAQLTALLRRARQSAVGYGVLVNGVRVGSQLLLLPLILNRHFLPESELALWWVFMAIGKLSNLADFGLSEVISRVYSYFWAGAEDYISEGLGPPPTRHEPNLPKLRQLDRALGYVYVRLAVVVSAAVALAGTAFIWRSLAEAPGRGRTWGAWAGYVVVIGYTLATNRWILGCQGVNRVKEMQAATLWGAIISFVCSVVMLRAHCGLLALVVSNAVSSVIVRLFCRSAYLKAVPPAGEVPLDLGIVKKLLPNARKFGLLLLGGYLLSTGNTLVCNAFLDASTTASWGLTVRVGEFLVSLSTLWLMVKWPEIAMLRTQGRLEELSRLFARRLALVMGTYLLGVVATLLVGGFLLRLKGSYSQMLPTAALIVYLAYLCQNLFYVQFGMLVLTENIVPFVKLSLFTGVGALCLSMILAPRFGVWGLLAASVIAEGVGQSWYIVRRGFQSQVLRPAQFLRAALGLRAG